MNREIPRAPGGGRAAFFRAGNRMTGHELAKLVAQGRTRRGFHVGLGAAAVGDHGLRFQVRSECGQYRWHLSDRHAEQDQIGARQGIGPIAADPVDQPELQGFLQGAAVAPHADHFADRTRRLQRRGKGTADQADAANDEFADLHSQLCSACSRAARKR